MAQENLPIEAPDDPANEQPLVSHLVELRNRMVKCAISIIVVFVALSPFMKQIFDFLSQPLMVALPQGVKLLATGVVAPFMVPLKVTLFVAFLIALPFVLYQIWAYVAPALYRREKRLALPILVSSIIMFAIGMAYCYFIVFRMVFQFKDGPYDKDRPYFFTVCDGATGAEVFRHPVFMDLTFPDRFGSETGAGGAV